MLEKFSVYGGTVLRASMSLVFFWFGFSQIVNNAAWTIFLPEWTVSLPFSANNLIFLNGSFEIFFGTLLFIGLFSRTSALILGVHLLGIALSIGFNPTGVRDFGLAFAVLSIVLIGAGTLSVDSKEKPLATPIKIGTTVLVFMICLGTALLLRG